MQCTTGKSKLCREKEKESFPAQTMILANFLEKKKALHVHMGVECTSIIQAWGRSGE